MSSKSPGDTANGMPGKRGFVASWQFASQGISSLLGSGFGLLLTSILTEAELQDWGWRIPFLFGVLIGPIGLYIRNNIEDATAPPAAKQDAPVRTVFMAQKFAVLLAVGTIATATAVNYLIIYMPTYVVKALHLPPTVGYLAAFAAAIAAITLNPVAGHISDRVGRTPYMDQGEIVEDAQKTDFFGKPRSDRAQKFLSKILSH